MIMEMSEENRFQIAMELKKGFAFGVDFGLEGVEDLLMDEQKPVGEGLGPNASRLLAAAVGNCLSASLLFCLRKSRVEVSTMKTTVKGVIARNEKGRWRLRELEVEIKPEVEEGQRKQLERCLELFEDFCVVTGSIKTGIPVKIIVEKS